MGNLITLSPLIKARKDFLRGLMIDQGLNPDDISNTPNGYWICDSRVCGPVGKYHADVVEFLMVIDTQEARQ